MGKRGPSKTPVEVRKAMGTHKPSRDGEAVPVAYTIPPCPFSTGSPEAVSWDRLIAVMRSSALDVILTAADQGTLEAAAIAWCRATQASADFAALTPARRYVQTRSNGLRPHPARDVERQAWADYDRYASRLGLNPSARANLSVDALGGNSPGGADNELDKLTRAVLAAGPQPIDE